METEQGRRRNESVGLILRLRQTLYVGNSVDVEKYDGLHALCETDEYAAQSSLGNDVERSILLDERLVPIHLVCKT
jgi:hypothetical protein